MIVTIAIAQLAFVVLTLYFLSVARRSRAGELSDDAAAESALARAVQQTMCGEFDSSASEVLAKQLGQLKPSVAVTQLLVLGGSRLSPEQLATLARRIRHEPWVESAVADGHSRKWWKRMSAARLLAMVGDDNDAHLLSELVSDRHPAVVSAATAAIAGRAGLELIEAVVRNIPTRSPAVRLQQSQALRTQSGEATPVLLRYLAGARSTSDLRAWLQLAEILGTPASLAAVIPFAAHSDAEVRTAAARAMRSCYLPGAVEASMILLKDRDWRVRAAAARAVAMLNAAEAVPLLRVATSDESWWVRYRAALALAALGELGRATLDDLLGSSDPFARQMASLVLSLSEASIVELSLG